MSGTRAVTAAGPAHPHVRARFFDVCQDRVRSDVQLHGHQGVRLIVSLVIVQALHGKRLASTAALRPEDLQVLEDSKPQSIAFLSRDELPLSIAMLFDMT